MPTMTGAGSCSERRSTPSSEEPHDDEDDERDPDPDAGDRERRPVLGPEARVRSRAVVTALGRRPGPVVVVPGAHALTVPGRHGCTHHPPGRQKSRTPLKEAINRWRIRTPETRSSSST